MTTVVVGDSQCLTSEMKLFQSLSNSATCCRIFSCPSLLFLLTEFHCVPPVHGIEAKMVVGTSLSLLYRFLAYSKPFADVPSISAVMRVVTQLVASLLYFREPMCESSEQHHSIIWRQLVLPLRSALAAKAGEAELDEAPGGPGRL